MRSLIIKSTLYDKLLIVKKTNRFKSMSDVIAYLLDMKV
jgi:predicted CopG family antitoxin